MSDRKRSADALAPIRSLPLSRSAGEDLKSAVAVHDGPREKRLDDAEKIARLAWRRLALPAGRSAPLVRSLGRLDAERRQHLAGAVVPHALDHGLHIGAGDLGDRPIAPQGDQHLIDLAGDLVAVALMRLLKIGTDHLAVEVCLDDRCESGFQLLLFDLLELLVFGGGVFALRDQPQPQARLLTGFIEGQRLKGSEPAASKGRATGKACTDHIAAAPVADAKARNHSVPEVLPVFRAAPIDDRLDQTVRESCASHNLSPGTQRGSKSTRWLLPGVSGSSHEIQGLCNGDGGFCFRD